MKKNTEMNADRKCIVDDCKNKTKYDVCDFHIGCIENHMIFRSLKNHWELIREL